MTVTDLEQAGFVRRWDARIRKVVRNAVGPDCPRDTYDDVYQGVYVDAWKAQLGFRALPASERTDERAAAMIGGAINYAAIREWYAALGIPRDDRQRGAGKHAQILRATLAEIGRPRPGRYAEDRLEAHGRHLAAYQLLLVGLVHGSAGLVAPQTRLLRQEVKARLSYAMHKLSPTQQRLIHGFYFEERTFKEVGLELGITGRSELWRLHRDALRILHREMIEFASALSQRNTGQTLDEDAPDLEPV